MPEALLLSLALAGYGLGAAVTALGLRAQRPAWPLAGAALAAAIVLHALALGTRWQAMGHGPFTTLHEILSSNLWSLSLVVTASALCVREVRHALWAALLPLAVLALWLVASNAGRGHLPPTYDTPLLYLHTLVGKLYLGLLLVAVSLGAMPWLRRTRWGATSARAVSAERFDELAHRFAGFAFVFDTLMLIVGAVWAQDAWGRYWAWDPLESWAFASWVALAVTLHARSTLRPSPAAFGAMLAGVFVLAFLTFFGVPFISMAPHKGAV
jgi:ABC-type transport system involved in cytochrome c biogenesis permease subunit